MINEALTLQFLTWISEAPRSYGAAMEAWRTSCPRLSIWEDAVREELVRLAPQEGQPMRAALVCITPRGLARLAVGRLAEPPATAVRA
jgi:hypothetical protein